MLVVLNIGFGVTHILWNLCLLLVCVSVLYSYLEHNFNGNMRCLRGTVSLVELRRVKCLYQESQAKETDSGFIFNNGLYSTSL